jgi:hypothetical protein
VPGNKYLVQVDTFVSFLLHTQLISSQSYIPPSAHKSKAIPHLVFYLDSNTKAIHTSTYHTPPTPPTTTMSSYNYSSSSSYTPQKGTSYSYSRPSTSSTTYSSTSTSSSSYSASSSTYQSLYTHSASSSSSRSKRYSKPPVIHNGGGKINDPNTSTSAPNGGYYN